MRQVEKGRKKFYSQVPFLLNPGKKIPKTIEKKIKKLKNLFMALFLPKTGMRQAEKEKKNFVPNSVHTRHGQENSEQNSKKIKKIKTPLPGIIFGQNEMRQAEKLRKKFQSRIPFILVPGKKILKRIAKKFKNLKNLILALFLAKLGLDRPRKRKKNSSPEFRSYSIRERKFRIKW